MKKSLILLSLLVLGLAACDGSTTSSSTSQSSSSSTTTSTSDSTGDIEVPISDITFTITVEGIDTYEDDHTTIWINSPLAPDNKNNDGWGYSSLTQSQEDANSWSITFTDVEMDQSYYYNIYYGTDTNPNWTAINNEGSSETPRSLLVINGTTEYSAVATFELPDEFVDSLTVTITPIIQTDVNGTTEELLSTNYVWAWSSHANGNVRFEKQSDNTWSYTFTNVATGVENFALTFVLGSDEEPDWSYQWGAYENGVWTTWNEYKFDVASDTTTITYDHAYFNDQPAEIVETSISLTVNLIFGEAFVEENSGIQFNYNFTNGTSDYIWDKYFKTENNINYVFTLDNIEEGASVYFRIYTWASNVDKVICYDENWTNFAVENINESKTVTISGCAFGEGSWSLGTYESFEIN